MASVFEEKDLFTTFNVEIQFRNKVLAGVPKNPKIIEGWLRSKAGITEEEEVRQAMIRTLVELGAEVTPDMTYNQLVEASDRLAGVKSTLGFKQNDSGLILEDRQIKAAIKEAVNILYAGDRWGVTKKGPRNFTAERVFISPPDINFLPARSEPDGVELLIVHANTPQGPRSSLSYHEYMYKARIQFTLLSLRNEIEPQQWAEIWTVAQEGGLGSCRSQSYGRFDVTKWDMAH